ncbi:hypothetical protein [Flavobacterium oreochromis]|uniref:Uncharacterized protein n=1 Tax=Flavobacterium columnare TaxID=996 RepID=A0A246G796_9FLAO|nr:hypothetical protein [Flavobacterium oreochromis]OWP74272.1 hypothetical protein BWK62_14700 [Flavobacterium oreochromis]
MKYLKNIILLFVFLNSFYGIAQCETVKSLFENDLYASKADDPDKVFDAWHLLLEEKSLEKTNAKVLKEVEDNYQAIKNAGGYSKWKNMQGAGNLNFSSLIKTNLGKLGVSDDIAKYILAPNSKGGAYVLQGVSVEAKEVALADEIFTLTNQRSIFPKNNLQGIEGFLEDGTAFTMKELESNFNSFATRINEMSSKIKVDPNFQWINAEGYLKIPFNNFTKTDGTIQAVTKQYVEQQFNAAIRRNAFAIKNDGTVKDITVFLQDGSNFKLDLTKLKP